MLVSDILISLSSELTENNPERVVKHNSNFIEGSYEKDAISDWKTSRTGKKPQSNQTPTECLLTSKTAKFYEVVKIEERPSIVKKYLKNTWLLKSDKRKASSSISHIKFMPV